VDVAFKDAVRISSRTAPDHTTGNIFGSCVQLQNLKALGVRDADVARLMHDIDRKVRRNCIQVFPGWVPLFCKLSRIISKAHDQVHRFYCRPVVAGPLLKLNNQTGNILNRSIGRRQQVRRQCLNAAHDDMSVGVDEPRNHGPSIEINKLGGIAIVRHDGICGTNKEDASVFLGNGFHRHGRIVHRVNGTAEPNAIGDLLCQRLRREQTRQKAKPDASGRFHDAPPTFATRYALRRIRVWRPERRYPLDLKAFAIREVVETIPN